MSNKGSNYLIWHLVLICLISCTNKSNETSKQRILYQQVSMQVVSYKTYHYVFNHAKDSINSWISQNLTEYLYEKNNGWFLDSLVCFNNKADKCVMAIGIRDTLFKPAVNDEIRFFYGVKIQDDWVFFDGAGIILFREYYQKDIHTPLSFEKIKEIAMKNIYSGYLKRDEIGKWVIDDEFFSDLTSKAWCSDCATQAQWDSAYFSVVKRNWEKK